MRIAIIISLCFLACVSGVFCQSWDSLGPPGALVSLVVPDRDSPDSVYAITVGASEPGNRLVKTTDAGSTWDTIGFYDGFDLHPATAETLFAAWGAGSFSDGIYRSNDYAETFLSMAVCWIYMADGVIYDQTEPDYLYGWGTDIYRSTDGGGMWSISYSASSPGFLTVFDGIAVDPIANNRIYAWDTNGLVILSTDRGLTWDTLTVFTETESPNDLAVAPTDTNIIYVANWSGVTKSTDCGGTWDLIPMPSQPSNCVYVSGSSSDGVIVGGLYGLRRSNDGGSTWDVPLDPIHDEIYDFAPGTDGSGGTYWYATTESNGILRTSGHPFTEGPVVSNPFPPDNAKVSLDSFNITLTIKDPDGLDSSTVVFNVDGIDYIWSDPELTVVDTGLIFQSSFASGDTVSLVLTSAEDALGNPCEMLPFTWFFTVDREPPELLFQYPDTGEVITGVDITAKFYIVDWGSGIDTTTFLAEFDTVIVDISDMAVLLYEDTFLVSLPTAGVPVDPGDTISVTLYIGDSPTIGFTNFIEANWEFYTEPTGIDDREIPAYRDIKIAPNPFNSYCEIEFPDNIRELRIYDIGGFLVRKITPDRTGTGVKFLWDGRSDSGDILDSGIYLIRFGEFSKTGKVIILK